MRTYTNTALKPRAVPNLDHERNRASIEPRPDHAGIVQLDVLRIAAAVATYADPLKGFLRVAHHYVDSAFWVAYAEFKHRAKG
jgi:hypothetical protein